MPKKKVFNNILLTIDILFAGSFLISAYSSYIDPNDCSIVSSLGLVFPILIVANFLLFIINLIYSYKKAIIILIAFIACWGQITSYIPLNLQLKEEPKEAIKIVSYNVMGFNGTKKNNKIIKYLANSNADIICLQEYRSSNNSKYLTQRDIFSHLKNLKYRDVSPVGERKNGNYLACFSKYPILEVKKIEYKSKYNGSVYYKIKIKNDTLVVVNNHLESNKLTSRDKEMYESLINGTNNNNIGSSKQLLRKLTKATKIRAKQAHAIAHTIEKLKKYPMIVCGDFNDVAISYAYHTISQNLTDAFTQSGIGLGISYNQNNFYFKIDNILINEKLKSYNCTVDQSIKESDHYPIWSYIKKL